MEMKKYRYEGPVCIFAVCATDKWSAETIAPTPLKAKNNMAYQYKKQHGLTKNAQVSLPGKIKEVEVIESGV